MVEGDGLGRVSGTMLLVLGTVDVLGLRKKIVGVSERGHDGR